jgi:dTMP kinase
MEQSSRGLFLTVEGVEGVGKSTNIDFIADKLKAADIPFVLTREPGGTPLAEGVRELLLQRRQESVSENTELLLMFAARAQHIDQVIEPALNDGCWVVCDRFTDATYAYQGGGRGVPVNKIADLERWVQGDLRPDFTVLLDAPVELGLRRARQRAELDRFEQETLGFFESVRDAYLAMAKAEPGRYRLIDASQPLEGVQHDLSVVLDYMISRFMAA